MQNTQFKHTSLALAMLTIVGVSPAAYSQESLSATVIEEIVTIGTRRQARSAADSIAPVDVIAGDDFAQSGDNDVQALLRTAVPSFNVNQQVSNDAASIIRPANLRGLSPDQTLVLVNGKRLHRSAVISILGGGIADGAQGPDISSIPSLALKQVEVLRDGAASQYGSDAIAGVLNFVINDAREGATLTAKYGSFYDGDGDNFQLAGNIGLPVGEEGFLNLTAEIQERDATSRTVQRADCSALVAAGNTAVLDPCQIFGDQELREDVKAFANFGTPVGENIELYGLASYATRDITGPFFFRNPSNRGGIFQGPTVDPLTGFSDPSGISSVLVGDLSVGNAGDCPAGIPLSEGGGLIPDPTILAQVNGDPNCFTFLELFPGGFTPEFGGSIEDWSNISNTINASLGPNTPTSFEVGGNVSTLDVFNADFSYELPVGLASDLNIGFGFEFRDEGFETIQGEPASFAQGILSQPSAAFPLGQGFAGNANGFAGFSSAASAAQDSTGYYLELEADVIEDLTVQAAVRYEDTEFFDDTTNFKIGALYRVNDNIRFRGTYSTGFRVPSAGQVNLVNTTTAVNPAGGLIDQGLFPLFSPAGQILSDFISAPVAGGGLGLPTPTLTPEESDSFTVGAAFSFSSISVTIDYFNIELDDRISQTDQFNFVPALQLFAEQNGVALAGTTTSEVLTELDAAGVLNIADFATAQNLGSFSFFSNDFDTRTQGIDIVANGPINFGQPGNTDFALAFNWTDTEVTRQGATVNASRQGELEDGLPNIRGSFTLSHQQGPVRGFIRTNYFGPFTEDHFSFGGIVFDVGSQITVDAEIGFSVSENVELIVGANNLAVTAPGGFNGGSYYFKVKANF